MSENQKRLEAIRLVAVGFGRRGWTHEREQVWLTAVSDLEGEAVAEGAAELVRDWTASAQPNPGHLRERALKHQRLRAAGFRAATPADRLGVDEAALVDALRARDAAELGETDLWTVAEAEEWIASIRRRLEAERVG